MKFELHWCRSVHIQSQFYIARASGSNFEFCCSVHHNILISDPSGSPSTHQKQFRARQRILAYATPTWLHSIPPSKNSSQRSEIRVNTQKISRKSGTVWGMSLTNILPIVSPTLTHSTSLQTGRSSCGPCSRCCIVGYVCTSTSFCYGPCAYTCAKSCVNSCTLPVPIPATVIAPVLTPKYTFHKDLSFTTSFQTCIMSCSIE